MVQKCSVNASGLRSSISMTQNTGYWLLKVSGFPFDYFSILHVWSLFMSFIGNHWEDIYVCTGNFLSSCLV